jgi:RsmE family RNA methyltransferase
MNLCILDSSDRLQSLSLEDRRARHILEVLKKEKGTASVRAARAACRLASLESITDAQLVLRFVAEGPAPPLRPVHVLLGTVRPIQAARIVKELTILGVGSITFFPTELGEKSYTQSNFYRQKEYYAHARDGAEQAGNPRIPHISLVWSLKKALDQVRITGLRTTRRSKPPRSPRTTPCLLALLGRASARPELCAIPTLRPPH